MIPLERAYEIVLQSAKELPYEEVPLTESNGRILWANVAADSDIPPARVSRMDGFACRREDLQHPLKEAGVIAAGTAPSARLGDGQCMRIMTGAVLPEGADTVVMKEHTVEKTRSEVKETASALLKRRAKA